VPEGTPFETTHVCLDGASCPLCGKELTLLGADSRKRVEFRPGHFIVLETVVQTGICLEHPHDSLFTPEGPDFIAPGGVLGNELLCTVLVDKFADNLPLHRQSNRFARSGVKLPDATLSRNVIASASLARHLVDAMRDELLESSWLQGDATGLPILIGDLGRAHGAQLWVYSNGESAVFQVSMTKHADFPKAFLEGFQGVWLADGASNYNAVASLPGVERAGCWSHGRRYVFEARNDHVAALEGLGLIRDLFMSERVAMKLESTERLAHRETHAAPLVARIRAWVDRWRLDDAVVRRPKSAFAKAVNYLHRQWDALVLFLKRAEIEVHNNRSELLLRGPVTGRRAWLFAGSPEGADASAIWFSLVASCMLQAIDPLVYLRDVLPGLAKKTPSEVRALTPARWAAARRAETSKVA
jgi:transposase